jgi:hypothetical protein
MDRKVGVWIDHRKAVVVSITSAGATSKTLLSEVEPRFHYSGGGRSKTYGSQEAGAERKREERYGHHLAFYYDAVVGEIGDAVSILIMGPGEAKLELQKRIEHTKTLAKRIVGVKPSDKLTDAQITAKVKEFYNIPR